MSKELTSQEQLNQIKNSLIDPLACELANKVEWLYLEGLSTTTSELYPVAVLGEGPPLLMLHGFDSSFLEFRRIFKLLKNKNQLIIPDLFGFGFCPRPNNVEYGLEKILNHLNQLIINCSKNEPVGIIAASMGGSIALELARRKPKGINQLLLLAPAGLANSQKKIPWPLDQLGTCVLRQPFVRKSLCRQAFANPSKSVGKAEEEIASLHLTVPGWRRSLASFARGGGISNLGKAIPNQPIEVIWGKQDRIIKKEEREKSMKLLGKELNEIDNCGHLPHLDKPQIVADYWQSLHKHAKQF